MNMGNFHSMAASVEPAFVPGLYLWYYADAHDGAPCIFYRIDDPGSPSAKQLEVWNDELVEHYDGEINVQVAWLKSYDDCEKLILDQSPVFGFDEIPVLYYIGQSVLPPLPWSEDESERLGEWMDFAMEEYLTVAENNGTTWNKLPADARAVQFKH